MRRLEMLYGPVGRAEVLRTNKAEWEGVKSRVEETAAASAASPFNHRLWCSCVDMMLGQLCCQVWGGTARSLKNISWLVPLDLQRFLLQLNLSMQLENPLWIL